MSVAKLFQKDKPICKEDFLRKVNMNKETPDQVKRFFVQIEFDEICITKSGMILIDKTEGAYSDA